MLICPIGTFRILRSLENIKYVQHMLAGGWYVHQGEHKANMTDIFVLITCDTEPFVAFLRILGDQSATRSTTLSKLTCAVLPFTLRFPFVIIEACLSPKVSVT